MLSTHYWHTFSTCLVGGRDQQKYIHFQTAVIFGDIWHTEQAICLLWYQQRENPPMQCLLLVDKQSTTLSVLPVKSRTMCCNLCRLCDEHEAFLDQMKDQNWLRYLHIQSNAPVTMHFWECKSPLESLSEVWTKKISLGMWLWFINHICINIQVAKHIIWDYIYT